MFVSSVVTRPHCKLGGDGEDRQENEFEIDAPTPLLLDEYHNLAYHCMWIELSK